MDLDECDWYEWLEGSIHHHTTMLDRCKQALKDFQNGEWWYEICCIPAYSDIGQDAIYVTGSKNLNESVEQVKTKFMEIYKDGRDNSMMFDNRICFKCGHEISLKEKNYDQD